jgi:hypothetical protein
MVSESEIDERTEIGGSQCAEAEKEEQAGHKPHGYMRLGAVVRIENREL